MKTISVITATLNCRSALRTLIECLKSQIDQDFEWIVVDGGSTDGTIEIAKSGRPDRTVIVSEFDFGIYDALNKGVRTCRSDYYLVVGSDDVLASDAIRNYRAVLEAGDCDIVAASVRTSTGALLSPMRGHPWLRGGNAYIASHAVGALIRRGLHQSIGMYSNRYTNCADMHFIMSATRKLDIRICRGEFVAGEFALGGISSVDRICSLSDAYRIQLHFGGNRWLQTIIFIARLGREMVRMPAKGH